MTVLHAPADAHPTLPAIAAATFKCTTSGLFSDKDRAILSPPFSQPVDFAALKGSVVWKNVLSHLLVNLDKKKPCFAFSNEESWTKVISNIPADVVGLQITEDSNYALIYVSGVADYQMEMPTLYSSLKPGQTYGIFRIAATPIPDDRSVHELSSKGATGLLVNGVSIFNYTDTFSYNDAGLWSFDANVAEATIVNSDISHATPSNLPNFPKSRGIFHNHQVSNLLLHQLEDPFVRGKREPSKLLGFAIDNNPIYGPVGHTSADASSGLKVLKSSYVSRAWLAEQGGGHRSSLPGWVVANWDNSQISGTRLLNLFGKKKADVLYSDGQTEGPVAYKGADSKLATEIKVLQDRVGLKRDAAGYVYWESAVALPDGKTVTARNYLLKSSELWGPAFDDRIVPAIYQAPDIDKYYFAAKLGSFAEDYEYIAGYGDLDFYNGIDSYLPDRGTHAYHYVTPFSADLDDVNRMNTASFPYFIGIQYKSKVDTFNDSLDNTERKAFFAKHGTRLKTVFDLGTVGKNDRGDAVAGSVVTLWRKVMNEE